MIGRGRLARGFGNAVPGYTACVTTTYRRFDLTSARQAALEGRIAEWVGDFLASPGSDNATLAAALAQRPHSWIGPIEIPIDDLTRLAGPEAAVECHIVRPDWEDDVESMADEIGDGWEPPPLLAEWSTRDGALLLHDGNHRYEALVREGASRAWVIIWFDDTRERDLFLATRIVVHPARRTWADGRTFRVMRAVKRRLSRAPVRDR
jgi:hypothetical protein